MITSKTVDDSRTEQVQIVLPKYVNSSYRLFGGQLMAWVDVVAAVVGRRHSGCNVTTAAVERLDFLLPASLDDILLLKGHITYAGKTSMEVCVDSYVEALDGQRKLVNRAYITLVAVDKAGKPTQVPALTLLTSGERAEHDAAKARRDARRS